MSCETCAKEAAKDNLEDSQGKVVLCKTSCLKGVVKWRVCDNGTRKALSVCKGTITIRQHVCIGHGGEMRCRHRRGVKRLFVDTLHGVGQSEQGAVHTGGQPMTRPPFGEAVPNSMRVGLMLDTTHG